MTRSIVTVVIVAMTATASLAANGSLASQAPLHCAALTNAVKSRLAGANASFLRSYDHGQDETQLPAGLASSAFVYDNALAVIALTACGDLTSATVIGNALSLAVRKTAPLTMAAFATPIGRGPSLRKPHCRGGGTANKIFGPKTRLRTAPQQATSRGRPWRC